MTTTRTPFLKPSEVLDSDSESVAAAFLCFGETTGSDDVLKSHVCLRSKEKDLSSGSQLDGSGLVVAGPSCASRVG